MFELAPLEIDIPTALVPVEEVKSILNEFALGHALREVALFRMWRLWRDGTYAQIYSDDPSALPNQPEFGSFGDFIKFLTNSLDVSRAKIYSRLKVYSLMKFLDFTDRQMIDMMASKPSLYERALNAIYVWDQELRAPTGMKTDYFGDSPFDEETKRKVKEFLIELGGFDNISDALKMLSHDVLGKPMIQTSYDDDGKFIVRYSSNDYDAETEMEVVGDSGTIYFEAIDSIPQWVNDELQRKFSSKV